MELVVAVIALAVIGGALLCLALIALATVIGRLCRVTAAAVSARTAERHRPNPPRAGLADWPVPRQRLTR